MLKLMFNTDIEKYNGEIDGFPQLILRFLFFFIPNIIDFLLTVLSYKGNIQIYYILRFIIQALYTLFCLSFSWMISYVNSDGIDSLPFLWCFICTGILVFLMEIPSLIFFIKYYSNLLLLTQISYYIHWILFPCLIIWFLLYNKNSNN